MTEGKELVPCKICNNVFVGEQGLSIHRSRSNRCLPSLQRDSVRAPIMGAALTSGQKYTKENMSFPQLSPVKEEEDEDNTCRCLLNSI